MIPINIQSTETIIENLLEYDGEPVIAICHFNNKLYIKWWADKDSWLFFQPTSIQDVKEFIEKPCVSPFIKIIKNSEIILQKNEQFFQIPIEQIQLIKDYIPCYS